MSGQDALTEPLTPPSGTRETAPGSLASPAASATGMDSGSAPERVTSETSITPSGLEIEFFWEPKRQYRLRTAAFAADARTLETHRPEMTDWVEVPSVTDVLSVLNKDGLHWWGMKVGVEGVLALAQMDLIAEMTIQRDSFDGGYEALCVNTPNGWITATVDDVVDLLKKQKLTVNHVRDKAGARGTAVHDVLEMWATGQDLPKLEMFPPEEQGYVAGLFAFLRDVPSAEPVASEVMVGSLTNGFAGRYDVRFRTTEEHAVVVHRTPVRGPQYARLAPGLYLKDLKTTKNVYSSHGKQLAAYEGASVECGYEPTDGRGVLLVQPDGTYKFVRSQATYQHFLNVLAVYRDENE